MGQVDDPLEIFGGNHGPGRVRRRIQDDGLGAGRDGLLDGIGGDAEVLRFAGLEENDLAAGILNDVFEADPIWDRQNHLIAVVHQHLDGVEQGQFAAGGEDRFVYGVIRTEVATMALDNGLAHVRNAGHHRVSSEIGVDRGDCRVLDVSRSRKVRFSRAEIDQIGALSAQFGSLGGDGHGCRDFNAANAIGKDLRRSGDSHDASIFTDFTADAKQDVGKTDSAEKEC
jgi:hypothetical protein